MFSREFLSSCPTQCFVFAQNQRGMEKCRFFTYVYLPCALSPAVLSPCTSRPAPYDPLQEWWQCVQEAEMSDRSHTSNGFVSTLQCVFVRVPLSDWFEGIPTGKPQLLVHCNMSRGTDFANIGSLHVWFPTSMAFRKSPIG